MRGDEVNALCHDAVRVRAWSSIVVAGLFVGLCRVGTVGREQADEQDGVGICHDRILGPGVRGGQVMVMVVPD